MKMFQECYGLEMAILGDEHFPIYFAHSPPGRYHHTAKAPAIDSDVFLKIALELVLTADKIKRFLNLVHHLKGHAVQIDAIIEMVIGVDEPEERIGAYMVHVLHVDADTTEFKPLVTSILEQLQQDPKIAAQTMMRSCRTPKINSGHGAHNGNQIHSADPSPKSVISGMASSVINKGRAFSSALISTGSQQLNRLFWRV